jgi:hypothetical protein
MGNPNYVLNFEETTNRGIFMFFIELRCLFDVGVFFVATPLSIFKF